MYPAPPVTKTFIGREPSRGERAAQWEKWGQAKSSGEMFDGRRARFCPANRAKPLECSRIPPLLVGQGAWLPIAKHQKKAAEYARTPNASRLLQCRYQCGFFCWSSLNEEFCRSPVFSVQYSLDSSIRPA